MTTQELIDRLTAAFLGHADHVDRDLFGRARDAIQAATQWQPIETAPKNGEWVLLYGFEPQDTSSEHEGGWGPCVVGRSDGDEGWDVGIYDSFCELAVYRPTHWMPLPAPPA